MSNLILVAILSFAALIQAEIAQIYVNYPLCDYVKVRETYPNPDFYYQKNTAGTLSVIEENMKLLAENIMPTSRMILFILHSLMDM
jgi:UDP-glucose 4-epimerase